MSFAYSHVKVKIYATFRQAYDAPGMKALLPRPKPCYLNHHVITS